MKIETLERFLGPLSTVILVAALMVANWQNHQAKRQTAQAWHCVQEWKELAGKWQREAEAWSACVAYFEDQHCVERENWAASLGTQERALTGSAKMGFLVRFAGGSIADCEQLVHEVYDGKTNAFEQWWDTHHP